VQLVEENIQAVLIDVYAEVATAFQIPSDRLKIERYNTIHGDKSKIPVPEPPPRQLELTMHSIQNQVQTVPSFHKNYHPLQFHKLPTFLLYFQNQFNLL